MLKILVISDYRNYHISRPEAEIFKGLAKDKNFKIFIMTFAESAHIKEFEENGITIINFHPLEKRNKTEIARIRQEIISKKIDILHLFNAKAIYSGTLAAKGLDVKVVLYRGFSSNVRKLDPFANLKFMNPRVDMIFCNSIGVVEHLHKQPFFDKNKTTVIHKGHKLEWYKDVQTTDIRSEFNIDKDDFLLVNVANNRKMKGIKYLLQAMNKLDSNLKIKLLLIGNDMKTNENMKLANDNVIFVGYRKDVLSIVKTADVFVLPSIFGESITKSVLESMSLGTPAIISDIRGNAELIEDNISGLVFKSKNSKELAEKIELLYNDRELLNKLSINALDRIKNYFNNEKTIEETKKLYLRLMK